MDVELAKDRRAWLRWFRVQPQHPRGRVVFGWMESTSQTERKWMSRSSNQIQYNLYSHLRVLTYLSNRAGSLVAGPPYISNPNCIVSWLSGDGFRVSASLSQIFKLHPSPFSKQILVSPSPDWLFSKQSPVSPSAEWGPRMLPGSQSISKT